ncbi:uncharacterized protein LOC118443130 [Vespa mandarinia]|uniref:uncharacterized protein LOC118443130 n=1 Tax=Vespa mandarinia TaxID=7446 RepID=UPI00160F8E5E|nr:uncharacterized protein LOC118443130 [Vespa mandarinia]
MNSTTSGISEHGRDTRATAVSGRAPQIGDLACGASNAPGSVEREECHLEKWQKAARAAEGMRFSGLTVRRKSRKIKRARPGVYSSEEDESGVDWRVLDEGGPAETPALSQVETDRNNYGGTQDLKAKLRAMEQRNKEITDENIRLKRVIKKRETPLAGKSQERTPDASHSDGSVKALAEAVRSVQQQQQQQRHQTLSGAATGAGGPHKGPTLRAESTRPPAQQVSVGKTLTPQEDFVQVLGRKRRRVQRREANALSLATSKDDVNDPQPLRGQAPPRKRRKGRSGAQRRKKRMQREREVAAISLSCTEETMYRDAHVRATKGINLKDLGIGTMSCRRGLTGAFIWQVRGKGANAKADRVAAGLKNAVPGAKITRPLRTSTIRLVGLDAYANGTVIRDAFLEVRSGTDPNLIKVREIRIGRVRLGEATVTAPTPVIRAALERGRIDVGLTKMRMHKLRQRPLTCHRCLTRGHVVATCLATKSRTDLCYVCGKPGHVAESCTDKMACPVCADAGRKQTNHRAGSWECPVVSPKKWVDKVFVKASNVCPEAITQKDPHKVAEKTAETVKVTEKRSVQEDMEVEQGVPGISIGVEAAESS